MKPQNFYRICVLPVQFLKKRSRAPFEKTWTVAFSYGFRSDCLHGRGRSQSLSVTFSPETGCKSIGVRYSLVSFRQSGPTDLSMCNVTGGASIRGGTFLFFKADYRLAIETGPIVIHPELCFLSD